MPSPERTTLPTLMTRVTAVIPCFNGEKYLATAIASVRAQTRPVDEILVIDDRSTDRSRDVAHEAGARVVTLDVNGGPSRARNAGLDHASGAVVAFLDADDVWTGQHCEIVVGLLERAPNAVLGFGRSAYHQFPTVISPASLPAGVPCDALEAVMRANPVTQSAAVVRREVVIEAGGYDATMRHSEDFDLWLRLALIGPFVCTHEITCWRDAHEAQASRNLLAMRRGAWQARARALTALDARDDVTRRRKAWEAAVAGWRHELREAWLGESPDGLESALAIRREYGLPSGPYWSGMVRRHVLWGPRQVARHVWRRARGRSVSPLLTGR